MSACLCLFVFVCLCGAQVLLSKVDSRLFEAPSRGFGMLRPRARTAEPAARLLRRELCLCDSIRSQTPPHTAEQPQYSDYSTTHYSATHPPMRFMLVGAPHRIASHRIVSHRISPSFPPHIVND